MKGKGDEWRKMREREKREGEIDKKEKERGGKEKDEGVIRRMGRKGNGEGMER